jgi:hypothetical protein
MTNMRHNGYHPPKENIQKEKENRCGFPISSSFSDAFELLIGNTTQI